MPLLFYHIIGKAIPGRTLFKSEQDHLHFLRNVLRFKWYALFEIHAYCLCGNHFHLAVRTRSEAHVRAELMQRPLRGLSDTDHAFLDGELDYVTYFKRAFGPPLAGYAHYANHGRGLDGQLFVKPTLHGLTDKHGEPGLHFSRRLVAYVALNYAKHHLAGAGEKYRWSSLHSRQFDIVDPDVLYGYFGGEEAFRKFVGGYLKRYGRAFYAFDEDAFFERVTPRHFDKVAGKWLVGEW